jgi:Citrate synthase, C-terminal domain
MADTLTITDNRTGRSYEIPIQDNTIRAIDLRQIKVNPEDFGMMTYDPAFTNTAACRSKITFIDGDRGILMYRGYPIEQLAEHSDSSSSGRSRSPATRCCTRTSRSFSKAFATTRTRWECS